MERKKERKIVNIGSKWTKWSRRHEQLASRCHLGHHGSDAHDDEEHGRRRALGWWSKCRGKKKKGQTARKERKRRKAPAAAIISTTICYAHERILLGMLSVLRRLSACVSFDFLDGFCIRTPPVSHEATVSSWLSIYLNWRILMNMRRIWAGWICIRIVHSHVYVSIISWPAFVFVFFSKLCFHSLHFDRCWVTKQTTSLTK